MVRSDSMCKRVEQPKRNCAKMSEDAERLLDPLISLDQIEDGENVSIDEEAVALLARLLENVEEFYELREKIMDLIEEDEITETKLIDLFQTLIRSGSNAGRISLARAKLK